MNKTLLSTYLLFCLLAGTRSLNAQSTKYWIAFNNKTGSPHVLGNANTFLSPKAINRRMMYNTPVDITDIPVAPGYIAQVENVPNVTVLYAIKWLNGVVVSIPTGAPAALSIINSFTFVSVSAPVNRYKLSGLEKLSSGNVPAQEAQRTANTASFSMGGSAWQNQQIHVDCLHNMGYRGQGITIAVMDVGFNNVDTNPLFDSLRNRNGILGTRDFVVGGNSVYEDPAHGAHVLSCLAAIKPGVIMGSAPMSDYWLLRTEDGNSETLSEEYNWIRGAEFADSVGADILTTSLGYTVFDNSLQNHSYAMLNGRTAPMSIAANLAARKGMFVLNAAGNEGQSMWQYIAVAGDADSICTVGAVDSLGVWAAFSSVGPTADGRKKPELVARGAGSWIGDVNGTCFPGNGTSFATPILAGGVACFWQAHRQRNNINILQLLKASGSNSANPNNIIGWGIPNVCTAAPLGLAGHNEDAGGVFVWPNPFHTAVTISINNQASKIYSIELTDVLGKILQTHHAPVISGNSLTLNTAALPEGVYFLRMQTTAGTYSKKIIRQ